MTAVVFAILGIFSFTLPKTPPKVNSSNKVSINDILGLDMLKLLKDKNFLIFFIASILICIPHAFYYQYAGQFLIEIGLSNMAVKMTVDQISEILFMLLSAYFLTSLGLK